MAREADPKGVRTLGVLTKPDQVEEGCHGQWLQVLQGKRSAHGSCNIYVFSVACVIMQTILLINTYSDTAAA